jgi:21S rRNA (uridine2791-2'-O)-methyltransferase
MPVPLAKYVYSMSTWFKTDQTDDRIQYELSLKTAELEIAYEKSLAQLDSLIAYEETRISRVDYIILDADHEILQMKCERSEYDIEQLLQVETALKQQLLRAQEDLANLQLSTRSDSRAMQDLKVDPVLHNCRKLPV